MYSQSHVVEDDLEITRDDNYTHSKLRRQTLSAVGRGEGMDGHSSKPSISLMSVVAAC